MAEPRNPTKKEVVVEHRHQGNVRTSMAPPFLAIYIRPEENLGDFLEPGDLVTYITDVETGVTTTHISRNGIPVVIVTQV